MSAVDFPAGWIELVLNEINIFASETVDPSSYPGETFELYSVPSFPSGNPEIIAGKDIGSTKQTLLPDDVLVCKINPRINRVWQVKQQNHHRQIGSSEWIGVRVHGHDPRFFRYYFSSPRFRELICTDLTGVGGSLTRAQPKRVGTFPVPVPPLNEQKRIADKLDTLLARVDTCRECLDRVPSILKRFRQTVLAAATSGTLTEEDVSSWEHGTLRELVVDKPRNGYSPKSVEYQTSVKSLTLTATTSGFFQPQYYKYIDEIIPAASYLWLEPGDILIQRANTLEYVGISAIFDGKKHEFIYPDLMMKCKVNNKVLPKFFHYLLLSEPVRQHFRDNATGTSGNMPKINQQTVLTAPMSWPTIALQSEIVRRVEALFAYTNALEVKYRAAREQVDRLTPALLAKAFRGELLPQDPNDEPAEKLLARIRATRAAQPAAPRARRIRIPRKTATPTPVKPVTAMSVPAALATAETLPASEILAVVPSPAPATPADTRSLADMRRAAGLNQAVVAKAMGLNQAYVSQMETGKRAISEAQRQKLAEILGVSVEEMPK